MQGSHRRICQRNVKNNRQPIAAALRRARFGREGFEVQFRRRRYRTGDENKHVPTLPVEPHTDMSALTVLVPNHVPGLQVSKDANWVAVDYLPNALFVHVGDQIEVQVQLQ